MTQEFSDERLEAVLRSIGDHLVIPPDRSPAPLPLSRHARFRPRRLVTLAAAVALIATGVLLVPASREAVADLLGIGSTRIEITGEEDDEIDDLPHIAQELVPISIEEAIDRIDGDLPDMRATALGPPDAIFDMPEGGVLLAWRSSGASLWVRTNTDPDASVIVDKFLASAQDIAVVDDLGSRAVLITGTHVLETPRRRLAAQSVLLWFDQRREYRLEADLSGPELIDLARAIR